MSECSRPLRLTHGKEVALDKRCTQRSFRVLSQSSGTRNQGCPEGGRPERLLLPARTASRITCSHLQTPGSAYTMISQPPSFFRPTPLYGVNKADFISLWQRGNIQQMLGTSGACPRPQSQLGQGLDEKPSFPISHSVSVSSSLLLPRSIRPTSSRKDN